MAKVTKWSNADLEAVRKTVAAEKRRIQRAAPSIPIAEDPTSPEVYLAYTPLDGIPGMDGGNEGDSEDGFTGVIGD